MLSDSWILIYLHFVFVYVYVIGFVDAFPGGGNKAPAKNAARILLRENTISVITVDANGADHGECDRRLGPLASDVESVPNVYVGFFLKKKNKCILT